MSKPTPQLDLLTRTVRKAPQTAARRILELEARERDFRERERVHAQREQAHAERERAHQERERALEAQTQALQQQAQDLTQQTRDLQDQKRAVEAELYLAQLRIEQLLEGDRLSRAKRFGASSEASPQIALFNEAEQDAAESVEDEADAGEVSESIQIEAHERKVARRKPLPKDLPRHVIEHPPAHTHCGCGAELVCIGTKTSEQLDVIPAQVFVIEHRRGSWKCPCCEDAVPETAPMPAQPIPKSIAAPGLLAHVAVAKYADGLPLYRQSKALERHGVTIPRQTLASHMMGSGALAEPMVEHLTAHGLRHGVLQMDETRLQVLEDGKRAQSQNWMWVIRGGPPGQAVIRYFYDPGRGGAVAQRLLAGYQGYLQTDGYSGYHAVTKTPGIRGPGCWAHARRKFTDVRKGLPRGKSAGAVDQVLAWIGKLYRIEDEIATLSMDDRTRHRQERSKPILEAIEQWLVRQDPPPKSLMGKAVTYLRNEWPRLLVYLEDGRLSIDNNRVENAIRPFAIGRKNWLFSATADGAHASAALYSLVETAKLNAANPYAYLKLLFTELPRPGVDLDALLPWNVERERLDDMLRVPRI